MVSCEQGKRVSCPHTIHPDHLQNPSTRFLLQLRTKNWKLFSQKLGVAHLLSTSWSDTMNLLKYGVWERHSRHKVGGKECYLGSVVWESGVELGGVAGLRWWIQSGLLGEVPSLIKKKFLGHKSLLKGYIVVIGFQH